MRLLRAVLIVITGLAATAVVAIALLLAAPEQTRPIRAAGGAYLRSAGIDDPFRYQAHSLLGEAAILVRANAFAADQFERAESHAANDAELSASLAGDGEALAAMGDDEGAAEVLNRAIAVDHQNERAIRLLRQLEARRAR